MLGAPAEPPEPHALHASDPLTTAPGNRPAERPEDDPVAGSNGQGELEGDSDQARAEHDQDRYADQTASDADQSASDADETARLRDLTAVSRDRVAEVRDRAAARQEEALRAADEPDESAVQELLAASAAVRRQAAADRARAAADRAQAAADRRHARIELQRAQLDNLTGVYMRDLGRATLQHEIDRSRRSGEPFVLAFVDVDGLKELNDREGHAAGDVLLQTVVGALRSKLRSYDPIVRVGGDEFLCGLTNTDLDASRRRVAEIRAAVEQGSAAASVTVGLAMLRDGDTIDDLTVRADAAMYAHKVRRRDA